jgi:hypothetical protein
VAEQAPVIPLNAAGADFGPLPAPSLRTYALAAVAARAMGDLAAAGPGPEHGYLLAHLRAVAPRGEEWLAGLPAYLRAHAPPDAPLLGLAVEMGLSVAEILAVELAAAVEDDVMAGRAFARLQAPLGGSRPTLSLLAAALAETVPEGVRPIDALADGPAARGGLLRVLGDAAPLPERTAAVPLHLCLALAGGEGAVPGCTLGGAGTVPLPPSAREQAAGHAAGLAHGGRALMIRTGSAAEGRAAAAEVARALGRRPLFVEGEAPAGLGPWLRLRGLVPVFVLDLAPGERRGLAPVPAYDGPVLAIAGPDGGVEMPGGAALGWVLGVPPAGERRLLWEAALGSGEAARALADGHRHGSGRIAALGRLARHRAALDGRERAGVDDVVAASRQGDATGLEALAQILPAPVPDEALVASPELAAELDTLLLRCHLRDGLADGLGASATARYRPGVRTLFVGPSGTGKTLAAGWLATRLGLPLYRVDLSSVTSKYIGETEKNLAQLLARAEQAEVVLLFDEADSLFGKRTDVKEANDRFANAQTNYLLQRIEAYDGIVVLTSNARGRFDHAFSRRLDMVVDFPLPGPAERLALWRSHLGGAHELDTADLNRLAATADLGGGHVRNAVMAAAARARQGGVPIGWAHVEAALTAEYRKLGKPMPAGLRSPQPGGRPWA